MIRNSNPLTTTAQPLYYNTNSQNIATASFGQPGPSPPPVTFGQPNTRTSTFVPPQQYRTTYGNPTVVEGSTSYG